ncbi:Uncharacterized membrane protein [Alkalispirochaeta americana]|uniref:Uncharacterized membrane protein n=1 Tax=Alkalispirochaeta americana TaxID=159291 RepID=A0A1N6QIK3_9SPIO|nr:AzlD domain-containing protein [Alkalispirochaeta americana]SIQ16206.1 Uncharacterized membrane protein [Alkalispirochaeta americana]
MTNITLPWILVCLGIFLGTYLGRALPFWFSRMESLPEGVKRFLEVVPAAALGALLFPDSFLGSPAVIAAAVVSLAFLLTLRGVGLTLVVLLTISLAWGGFALLPG